MKTRDDGILGSNGGGGVGLSVSFGLSVSCYGSSGSNLGLGWGTVRGFVGFGDDGGGNLGVRVPLGVSSKNAKSGIGTFAVNAWVVGGAGVEIHRGRNTSD